MRLLPGTKTEAGTLDTLPVLTQVFQHSITCEDVSRRAKHMSSLARYKHGFPAGNVEFVPGNGRLALAGGMTANVPLCSSGSQIPLPGDISNSLSRR